MKFKAVFVLIGLVCASESIFAQEHAVDKPFRFFVGYDGVKTEAIALDAQAKIAALPGVSQASMNWPHYQLTFVTSSAKIEEHDTFSAIKLIFNEMGIGITIINREDEQ